MPEPASAAAPFSDPQKFQGREIPPVLAVDLSAEDIEGCTNIAFSEEHRDVSAQEMLHLARMYRLLAWMMQRQAEDVSGQTLEETITHGLVLR